jgi:hypothetical protein
VTGGMFPLNDEINPERFSAVFYSGASAFYDAASLSELGLDIGVVAGLVHRNIAQILKDYLKRGGKVFVDSGAYGQHEEFVSGKAASPIVDFGRVFGIYRDLMDGLPQQFKRNLTVVMPDVLCDLRTSLELLRLYRAEVLEFIASGINVIVPVQKGENSAGRTVEIIKDILDTSDFTVGIPSAAAAMDIADVATIRNHHRFHVLGRGAMDMPLFQRVYAFLEHNVGADVSCDANQIRSHTPVISFEQQKLIEQCDGDIWTSSCDETEMLYNVLHSFGFLSKNQITAIAAFYGVTESKSVKAWVSAHEEDGLSELINEIDPGASMMKEHGLQRVFSEYAEKKLSARMRKHAMMKVFGAEPSRRMLAPANPYLYWVKQ